MLRLPLITPRTGRFLITTFLLVKVALLLWNAVAFDGKVYDQGHHQDRALFGGLRPGKMAYNPPLYYLPALLIPRPADVPLVERSAKSVGDDEEGVQSREAAKTPADRSERSHKKKQIKLLRYTNVFYGSLFYLAWIGFAFPRLLGSFRGWFLASLLLLAIPGYQKLGVMVHPDNLFACTTSLGVCAWLFLRAKWRRSTQPAGLAFRHLVGMAVATGLIGLTRPFSVVPVAVLTGVVLVYLVRLERGVHARALLRTEGLRWQRLVVRGAALLAIIGVMSGSWYVYRWRHSGHVTNAYRDHYIAKFEGRRVNFDFVHYFTSVHLKELLETPNRKLGGSSPSIYANNPLANSFFTVLHSEVWGDQWLYFSGAGMREGKLWPKRVSLTVALAVPFIVGWLGLTFLWDWLTRLRRAVKDSRGLGLRARATTLFQNFEQELVLLGIAGLGAALYMYWQTGPALLPGKNSTIKFIYIAGLFPPTLALLFRRRLRPLSFNLLSIYFFVLFIAAFPVAMYWPP